MDLIEDIVLDELAELLAVCCKNFAGMSFEICLREVPGVLINSVELARSELQEEVKTRDRQVLLKLCAKLQEHLVNKFLVVLDVRQIVVQ